MKKSILTLIVSLTIMAGLSSCSDFLDQPVLGEQTLDTYFQTEDECVQAISGCYQALFFNDWWQVANFQVLSNMCTDDMWMGNTTQGQSDYIDLAHYKGTNDNGASRNYWMHRYKGIYLCNIAINRIPQASMTDKNLQNRLVAEARFLRGLFYFELVKNYGGIPIVLTEAMPTDVEGISRATLEESYEQVEKDLLYAMDILPERSEYPSADMGRATKGAASGFLAKVYLYQEKYEDAELLLKDLYESTEYELLDDFGQVWDLNYNNSKEGLFEVQYIFDETYALGASMPILTGNRDDSGWAWGLPTANLEKAFVDAGDDVRLKWTIIKHGASEIAGEDNMEGLIDNLAADIQAKYPGVYVISPEKHKSARVSRKFFIPYNDRPAGKFDKTFIPQNHRMLRYADVLLMYAEVENALGHDDIALIALNDVRGRVDLEEVKSTGTELRDAIRLERRLELALESERLYDIRRWKDSNGKRIVSSLMGPNGTFVEFNTNEVTADAYEFANQKESSDKGYYFDEERDLLFPIPLSEITMSDGTIEQNPGY